MDGIRQDLACVSVDEKQACSQRCCILQWSEAAQGQQFRTRLVNQILKSMITWSSSPDRVVNRSCNTSWRSLLTSELVCDISPCGEVSPVSSPNKVSTLIPDGKLAFVWERLLHEWRRCVCRLCTSHLSRVKRELPTFFFHECGRHVGGVPRSSLKGKETRHNEGDKNTSDPKQAKTHQTKTRTTNPKTTTARGRFPLIKVRFLCTKVRHVKTTKADC